MTAVAAYTRREQQILDILRENGPMTRTAIAIAVMGYGDRAEHDVLRVNLTRMRRKGAPVVSLPGHRLALGECSEHRYVCACCGRGLGV